MSYYPLCPSCGTLLGNKLKIYYDKIIQYIKEDMKPDEIDKKKTELVNNLGFENYCCKMRIRSFIMDLPNHIK
jgi:DNA-directed RNA polymerase subunit N (RpoN/RPB10)